MTILSTDHTEKTQRLNDISWIYSSNYSKIDYYMKKHNDTTSSHAHKKKIQLVIILFWKLQPYKWKTLVSMQFTQLHIKVYYYVGSCKRYIYGGHHVVAYNLMNSTLQTSYKTFIITQPKLIFLFTPLHSCWLYLNHFRPRNWFRRFWIMDQTCQIRMIDKIYVQYNTYFVSLQ